MSDIQNHQADAQAKALLLGQSLDAIQSAIDQARVQVQAASESNGDPAGLKVITGHLADQAADFTAQVAGLTRAVNEYAAASGAPQTA